MPLSGSPYVCMSCRHAASQVTSRARSLTAKRRGLSYTAAERRGRPSGTAFEQHATGSAHPEHGGQLPASPPGRYSRALLGNLLNQLSKPEDVSHVRSTRSTQARSPSQHLDTAPARLEAEVQHHQVVHSIYSSQVRPQSSDLLEGESGLINQATIAQAQRTQSENADANVTKPARTPLMAVAESGVTTETLDHRTAWPSLENDVDTKQSTVPAWSSSIPVRPVLAEVSQPIRSSERQPRPFVAIGQRVTSFNRLYEQREYYKAWRVLQRLAREHITGNTYSLSPLRLCVLFRHMLRHKLSYRPGRMPQDIALTSIPQQHFLLNYLQVLSTLGYLSSARASTILSLCIDALVSQGVEETVEPSCVQELFCDIMHVWHHILCPAQSRGAALGEPGTATAEWDWSFLNSVSEHDSSENIPQDIFSTALEPLLAQTVAAAPHEDLGAAVLLTLFAAQRPYARTTNGSLYAAYTPLIERWESIYRGTKVMDLPRVIRLFPSDTLRGVITQLKDSYKISMPAGQRVKSIKRDPQSLRLPLKSAQPLESEQLMAWQRNQLDRKSGPILRISAPKSDDQPQDGSFERRYSTLISRAIERKDPAQADRIAIEILNEVQKRQWDQQMDHSIWERVVMMYIDLQLRGRAIQVLEVMARQGIAPSPKLWTVLIKNSARFGDKTQIDSYWRAMLKQGIIPDNHIWSARLTALVEGQRPDDVLKLLAELGKAHKKDGTCVSVALPNAAIAAMYRRGDSYNASVNQILGWMGKNGIDMDVQTYNPLLAQAMRTGRLERAFTLLRKMDAQGVAFDSQTATELIKGLFSSSYLDEYQGEVQTQKVLDVINDIEENYLKAPLDVRAYGATVDGLLRRYGNTAAVYTILARMREKELHITPHIYTMLLNFFLAGEKPDAASLELLWRDIKATDDGWGAKLDARFYDRALEGLCTHHRVLGIEKIVEILDHLPKMSLRPSWPALTAVAEVFNDRGEDQLLLQLVERLRTQSHLTANHTSQHHGYSTFWKYIVQLGLLKDEDITSWEEIRLQRRRATQFTEITAQT